MWKRTKHDCRSFWLQEEKVCEHTSIGDTQSNVLHSGELASHRSRSGGSKERHSRDLKIAGEKSAGHLRKRFGRERNYKYLPFFPPL